MHAMLERVHAHMPTCRVLVLYMSPAKLTVNVGMDAADCRDSDQGSSRATMMNKAACMVVLLLVTLILTLSYAQATGGDANATTFTASPTPILQVLQTKLQKLLGHGMYMHVSALAALFCWWRSAPCSGLPLALRRSSV